MGIFINFTQAQRDAIRTSALERITSGERTSLSGGGKSGSRQWQMSPQDTLFELDYADQIASGVPRPNRVVQVLNQQYNLRTDEVVILP